MSHPIAHSAAQALRPLRASAWSSTLAPDARLSDGVYVSWDTEGGALSVTCDTTEGTLAQLQADVTTPPRWFSLNIDLGEDPLMVGDLLALTTDLDCDMAFESTPFIRSASAGDTPLEVTVRTGLNTVFAPISGPCGATTPGMFHTLVLPLPAQSFRLALRDLRVSVLSSAQDLRLTPVTLASYGG